MESGIIELASVFKGSAETTAEEMKEYMQGVVTRFCGVTGLVVLETVEHERGAFFILGEEGKTQGIVAIGNPNNNYHYQLIGVSRVGVDNAVLYGTAFASNAVNNYGCPYRISTNPIWMKYIKTDHGIAIALKEATRPGEITPNMIFNKIQKGNVEEMAMLFFYNLTYFASYNPELENGVENSLLFSVSGCNKNTIPQDKEALAEIYLESRAVLPGMRLYTNKKNANVWNMVRIGTAQYIVAFKGNIVNSNYTLLMQASDADQT